jgi:RNA polymerase sigma-70 factor, ECF subfamily
MGPVAATPAFSRVFREHVRYVWRALRYLGVREADLDDVCQEVFLVVHRKLEHFEGGPALRAWLYAIAVRVAADYRKSAYQRRERPAAEPNENGVAAAAAGQVEARQELQALLDCLDEAKREVLVLYQLEGFSMPEVAEILGVPVQTAYTRMHAARSRVEEVARRRESWRPA